MHRLQTHKYQPNLNPAIVTATKTTTTTTTSTSTSTSTSTEIIMNSSNNNSNSIGGHNGLFTKLTKRYSTLSSRITRRHHAARNSTSPQKQISGSYDMTGLHSDDHRLEIGAPILISTTTLDTDRFDVSEARLRQINGGIAGNSTLVRTVQLEQSSPQIPSSGSENEMYVDALCSTPKKEQPPILEMETEGEEHFELASTHLETPKRNAAAPVRGSLPSTKQTHNSSSSTSNESGAIVASPLNHYYESNKRTRTHKFGKKQHSKSAQNLHRSEMKVFLQKAPSMALDVSSENCPELPKLPELFGASKASLAATDTDYHDADKENSSPSVVTTTQQSKSVPNTPVCPEQKVSGYLKQQHFQSIDSLNMQRNGKRRSVVFSSSASMNQHGSKNSLTSHNSTLDDFNLKSVSCQSLNAQSLFVSIEELNDLTRQINESEDFDQDIDLEYCTHRDNLKPSERRITLLKNKNTRLINFNNNKEKLKKGWSEMKHWIGEESSKLKEVMQKQTMVQKMSGSKMNLSIAECRKSPSVHGSVVNTVGDGFPQKAPSALYAKQSPETSANDLSFSCDNIAEEEEENKEELGHEVEDDLESSYIQQPEVNDGENSPIMKRARREGQNGFEELRRYVKQGGDFGKELILILQERIEAELLYSKSLSKMANKLNKACRELPGSIADAWRGVATEMESRSDIHRQLSASLTDEIVKPLKSIVDSHHKSRKTVESNVDKAARVLAEWRVSEAKAKKASHTAARENEKLQDAMLDVRIQKSPSIALLHQGPNKVAAEKEIKSAEKDCAKLDNKRKKAEETVKRADVEYYTLCVRAERARVDWEMAVLRGSSLLQSIENQRLINMKNFVSNYTRLTADMNPILDGLVQRLLPQVEACNVVKDMQVVKNIRRNSEGPSEQLLPDFYCEHTTLAMNRERRKHALIKLLQLVKTDLERERRSRNGLKGLSQSLNNQENQNITDKLYHIRSMLTYLEGARFKLHSALLELDHKPRTSHPLAQHIQITRDRTGLQQSILKVPLWLKHNDKMANSNSAGDSPRSDNEYDCISQANTSTNISCSDISKDMLTKSFSRSKSNIETFSTISQICVTNTNINGSSNALVKTNGKSKTKTITANLENTYSDRGQADGGSNQQDSDFDEFSSQEDDDEQLPSGRKEHKVIIEKSGIATKGGATATQNGVVSMDCADHQYQNSAEVKEDQQHSQSQQCGSNCTSVVLSRCKALYSYTPKLYDELELNPGDIIEVHAKQEDGWWLGALGNQVGIFPATYVEEFA